MKKIWKKLGVVAFWLSWPLLFFYLRRGKRTRVLIVHGDKAVVLRVWLGGERWALPGGGLHKNESAKAGAVREVLEETGITLEPKQLISLGTAYSGRHGLSFEYEQFVVRAGKKLKLKPQRLEITEVRWIPYSELNKNNAEEATLNTLATWKKQM